MEDGGAFDLFQEPDGYYKDRRPPSFVKFTRDDGREFDLRLIGEHTLWGGFLWNAAKRMASLLDKKEIDVEEKLVLELGAGAALPSLCCAHNGAKKVVCTDYPEEEITSNIQRNVETNVPQDLLGRVEVMGYKWGSDVAGVRAAAGGGPFDIVILSDVICNHDMHAKLLTTAQDALKGNPSGKAIVAFSPHRPHLLEKDMAFFDMAKKDPYNFTVELHSTVAYDPMFPEDPGPADVRSQVHVYMLTPSL